MVRRAALLGTAALALGATPALAAPSAANWLDATVGHRDKLPAGFEDRLDDTLADGTLGVIVSTTGRGPVVKALASTKTTFAHWYDTVDGFYAHVTPMQLAALLASPTVEHVAPDYRMTFALSVSTPDAHARQTATQPGLYSLDMAAGPFGTLNAAWPTLNADQATGKGVTAAVVDSGIDGTARDFGGWDCVSQAYQPCESRIKEKVTLDQLQLVKITPAPPSAEPTGEPTTDLASGHGTHVAGIIAGNGRAARETSLIQDDLDLYGGDGRQIGMAPQASLVSVKAGDSQYAGLYLFGLDWVNQHASQYGIRVVNNSTGCSGGCDYDPAGLEDELLRGLYGQGIVTTFAAGNDAGGPDGASLSGSAQSPWVLGVANYDAHTHRLAASSSRGVAGALTPDPATWTPQSEPAAGHRRPDIAAPGENVWSVRNLTGGTSALAPRQSTGDVIGGTGCCIRDYAVMSGTSMATPHVTGAAVLLFSACPSASALDVMRALMASAGSSIQATDGSRPAEAYEVGYGRLDVTAAVSWLQGRLGSC